MAVALVVGAGMFWASSVRNGESDYVSTYVPVTGKPAPLRLAAFGDSLTVPKGGWLDTSIDRSGGFVVANASVAGSPTGEFLDRMGEVDATDPNVVVILGGTNDVGRNVPTEDTVENITTIADHYAQRGAKVVLATIPPYDKTPGKSPAVHAVNAAITDLAAARSWGLIDFYTVLASADSYAPGLTEDGIHPTPSGIARMTDTAAAVFKSVDLPVE